MLRSVYAKLAVVMSVLFVGAGLLAIGMTLYTTRIYRQEVDQRLNRDLARNIAAEKALIRDNTIDRAALQDVFHMMMVINPSIELYLLDMRGKILAYSAEPGKVKRDSVATSPMETWLADDKRALILGDDPRDPAGKKAFSAARITGPQGDVGYLYIILGGENYETAAQMLAGSYILNASVWVLSGGFLLAAAAGLILFALITGKLKRLSRAMRGFERGKILESPPAGRGDEIDQLHQIFHQMAHKIAEQTRHLERTDTMRREMIADISHDLRTPLATLQGYIETLAIKNDALTGAERSQYLEIALKHCHHITKLVGELLELARLDALESQPRREAFSLPELAQDIVQKYRLKAGEKEVRLELSADTALPFVHADIGLIERALENLIENALRYTPRQGLVELKLFRSTHGVAIEVRDSGGGIAEEDLPRIFDRFYQADKARNRAPGTTGLGLSIAKKILELHGASIEVRSALRLGTTFSFQLPMYSQ